MNPRTLALASILAPFLALNAYAAHVHGYVGVFETILATTAGTTVFVDLCIALGLVTVWLWQDARARGVSPFPYMVLTLALGSVGPLLYLLLRERQAGAAALRPATR